jgi:hypothetical protein
MFGALNVVHANDGGNPQDILLSTKANLSFPFGSTACPRVGVVKPAGASVAACCAMRAIAATTPVRRNETTILRVEVQNLLSERDFLLIRLKNCLPPSSILSIQVDGGKYSGRANISEKLFDSFRISVLSDPTRRGPSDSDLLASRV